MSILISVGHPCVCQYICVLYGFSLLELSLLLKHYVICWCLLWCLPSAFRFQCGCHAHKWGFTHWGLQCHNPLEDTLGRCMPPGDGLQPIPGVHQVIAPITALSRVELHATYSAVPQPFHLYGEEYSSWCFAEYPITPSSLHGEEGSSFQGSAPPDDTGTQIFDGY